MKPSVPVRPELVEGHIVQTCFDRISTNGRYL